MVQTPYFLMLNSRSGPIRPGIGRAGSFCRDGEEIRHRASGEHTDMDEMMLCESGGRSRNARQAIFHTAWQRWSAGVFHTCGKHHPRPGQSDGFQANSIPVHEACGYTSLNRINRLKSSRTRILSVTSLIPWSRQVIRAFLTLISPAAGFG